MTVTSSTNASTSDIASTDATNRVTQKTLGQKEFLKLIAAQLTHQDPMKPMDDTTFIAQMANFSSLEQMSQMRSSSDLSFARSLIGQLVTVRDPQTQKDITGEVTGVDVTDKGANIIIDDSPYGISTVKAVRPMPVETMTEAQNTEASTPTNSNTETPASDETKKAA